MLMAVVGKNSCLTNPKKICEAVSTNSVLPKWDMGLTTSVFLNAIAQI